MDDVASSILELRFAFDFSRLLLLPLGLCCLLSPGMVDTLMSSERLRPPVFVFVLCTSIEVLPFLWLIWYVSLMLRFVLKLRIPGSPNLSVEA